MPDWFVEEIRKSLDSDVFTRYPVQDKLHRQLCDELQLPREQVLLCAGADAAIKALYRTYIRPGDAVVMLDPSYAMYSVYAQMFRAETIPVSFDSGLVLDTKDFVKSINSGVRIVMLANPNQPTATLLDEDVLLKVLKRTADMGALVAIDESYQSFSGATALSLVKQHAHLVVIRSFSKAAGLAGLRIGFVAGHPDVVANLNKVRSVSDVNTFAILCASEILKHPQIINDYVAEIETAAQLLSERVRAMGLTPLRTYTNFMLIRVTSRCKPARLVESLRIRGYLVKGPFIHACLADCIRVTLGPRELMMEFSGVLEETLSKISGDVDSD